MLKFNSEGKFGILIFGDLHEKEDYKDSLKFKDMQKLMTASLNEFNPDLCVLMGDVLSTDICKRNPSEFEQGIRDICAPILERNIQVAYIMGNHEHDSDCDTEIINACNNINGLIMRCDGVKDKTDFKEILYSNDGRTPKAVLWFLNSNNLYSDAKISVYDCVHKNQIEWFEKENEKVTNQNSGTPLPSYIFQHIPVPEEYRLLRKANIWEYPISVKGHSSLSQNRYVKAKGTKGYLGEGPCSPDVNEGQFDSWKKAGNVKAAFFGHDHLNDISGFVDGIFLAQHKTAGFRAYTDGCRSCVRYVEIKENSPDKFTEELKHFKEFNLKSESLGPVMRHITDRQSIALRKIAYTVGSMSLAFIVARVIKKYK